MNHRDRGSASVLVLAMAAMLVLVALLLAGLAAVAVTRHRAASAADLAALAAADAALRGSAAACAAAARAASRGAAELQSCELDGDVAQVVVAVRPGGVLGRLGAARAVARAGPATPAVTPVGTPPPPRASGCRQSVDLPRLLRGRDCAPEAFHAQRTSA